jgi:hypothetical protein
MARGEITGRKPFSTADQPKRRHRPPCVDPDANEPTPGEEPEPKGGSEEASLKKPVESTVHKEPKPDVGTKSRHARDPPTPPAAYSIRTFCAAHHLSEAMFYKMKTAGWGPAEMKVGARVLISFEAAARWRAEREAAARAEVGS